MPYLPQRLAALHHWLCESLSNLRYPNNAPFVKVLTRLPERIAPLKTSPQTLGITHLMSPPSIPAFVPPTPLPYFGSRGRSLSDTISAGRSSTSPSLPTITSPTLAAGAWGSSVF